VAKKVEPADEFQLREAMGGSQTEHGLDIGMLNVDRPLTNSI
jgi:hypothetical protein